ncbi:MAG: FAD-binding protein [Dehalobacterium sp.]
MRIIKHTDVVIVGGGLGGMMAAKTAAEMGVNVTLIDKAYAATSGPTAFAAGDFLAWLPEEDSLDEWVNYYLEVGEGLNSKEWVTRLFEANYQIIKNLDREGFYISKNDDGSYLRRGGRGKITKCLLIPAYRLMKDMRKYILAKGVHIIDRVQVVALTKTAKGKISGVAGFNKRTGKEVYIQAKAVILAAGGCSYRGPFFGQDVVSGEGINLAYKAGAELAYMEYGNHFNVSLKEFDTYGQSKFMAHGGKYINRLGEDFLLRTGEGSRARGHIAVRRMVEEARDGRGPIYLDLREFHEEELIKELMPNLALLLESSKIDFYHTPNEAIPALTGTSNASSAGVFINNNAETSLKGLFAAGDNACKGLVTGACVGLSGISLAWANVTGYLAGKSAAELAKNETSGFIPEEQNNIDPGGIYSALKYKGKYHPREIIWELSALMGNGFVMILKSRERLLKAQTQVRDLIERLNRDVLVNDYHELMIWHEARSALKTAELTLAASIFREETRGGHYREDFPTKSPELNKLLKLSRINKRLELYYADI